MAIIKCPACGKQITDRMEKCPHCNTILIEKQNEEPITKESIKSSAKDSIIGVVSALVLTLVVEKVWSIITCIYAGKFMGSLALEAVSYAESVFDSKNLMLLIVDAVLFCVIGFIVQNGAIMNSNVPPDVMMHVRYLSIGFGFAFPMVLGCLSISSYERKLKKGLLTQVILAVVFT